MGTIRKPLPVKLISGFIFKEDKPLLRAESALKKKFGDFDFQSPVLDFTQTAYYQDEFGRPLKRKFVSFSRLVMPQQLPAIKAFTNKIEAVLKTAGRRTVNIDPGYLDLAKLVLASTKDYVHRVYLGKGIFAEMTLFYEKGAFHPWKWTYPDYRTSEYARIFDAIRTIYAAQLKSRA